MWKWFLKMLRRIFGPSLKRLESDFKSMKNTRDGDLTTLPQIQKLMNQAEVFKQDNPEQSSQVDQYISELLHSLFEQSRFTLLDNFSAHLHLLSNDIDLTNNMISAGKSEHLAFLLYHGARVTGHVSSPKPLIQVMLAWDNQNTFYKPFLKEVYHGLLNVACQHFNKAMHARAFGAKLGVILTHMKKAVLDYLFPQDRFDLTATRLPILFYDKHGAWKPFYDLLNSYAGDGNKTQETKTIQRLRDAQACLTHSTCPQNAQTIIAGLMKAETLDVIMPVEPATVSRPLLPAAQARKAAALETRHRSEPVAVVSVAEQTFTI